jgi:hypothetical protein
VSWSDIEVQLASLSE